MRLDEIVGPVEGDVVGEILAEAGPLAPDAGDRPLRGTVKRFAEAARWLNPGSGERRERLNPKRHRNLAAPP